MKLINVTFGEATATAVWILLQDEAWSANGSRRARTKNWFPKNVAFTINLTIWSLNATFLPRFCLKLNLD